MNSTWTVQAQQEAWYTLETEDANWQPEFAMTNGKMGYTGRDQKLKAVLSKYDIYQFTETKAGTAGREGIRKFFVRTSGKGLIEDLKKNSSSLFSKGKRWSEDEMKIYEPNDYGSTSTIGSNQGAEAMLDYLDVLGLPQAWYYSTGTPQTVLGVADGIIDTLHPEFAGKVKVYQLSTQSNGHGSGVAAVLGARGDNGVGIPGICYDCNLAATRYGGFRDFKQLRELSDDGVRVINCSWVSSRFYDTGQAAVDEMFAQGTVLVAGAGNKPWSENKGQDYMYPASYDKVISVSSVMWKYERPEDNLKYQKSGKPYVENIFGFVGRTAGYKDGRIGNPMRIYPVATATLNSEVDLVAPAVGVLQGSALILEDKVQYIETAATSVSAPFVTGTIGLMLSLYPCLSAKEIEPILKLTATRLDKIAVNEPFRGNYGAGMLHSGRAVKLVHDLFNPEATARISNQRFDRWNFPVRSFSKEVCFSDLEILESAQLELTASTAVILEEGTHFKPGPDGSVHLKIDSDMEQNCKLNKRSD
ncbi:hypothetical protein BST85_07990 [Aureitalea marina]|uniref:Peptidase S8/S53 domain-containing protein n=1 Tax=Aureitalea marina TaxID=930804 RepID=A0A2S7KQF2_9FLAO|nr:hypothetical protein BST85_07990 [Aureitalea marina]